jgi:hypothetical protein
MVGHKESLQAASNFLVSAFFVRLDELAAGEFGVQSPATSTNTKGSHTAPFCIGRNGWV